MLVVHVLAHELGEVPERGHERLLPREARRHRLDEARALDEHRVRAVDHHLADARVVEVRAHRREELEERLFEDLFGDHGAALIVVAIRPSVHRRWRAPSASSAGAAPHAGRNGCPTSRETRNPGFSAAKSACLRWRIRCSEAGSNGDAMIAMKRGTRGVLVFLAMAGVGIGTQACKSKKAQCDEVYDTMTPVEAAKDKVFKAMEAEDLKGWDAALKELETKEKVLDALSVGDKALGIALKDYATDLASFAALAKKLLAARTTKDAKATSATLVDLKTNAKKLDDDNRWLNADCKSP